MGLLGGGSLVQQIYGKPQQLQALFQALTVVRCSEQTTTPPSNAPIPVGSETVTRDLTGPST